MNETFEFEDLHVRSLTTDWVGKQIASGVGGLVYGPTGTGKSSAVRADLPVDARLVAVEDGPLMVPRLLVDLASGLGNIGRPVLETYHDSGANAALGKVDAALNGHALVVDRADRLCSTVFDIEEPTSALWQSEALLTFPWVSIPAYDVRLSAP